MESTSPTRRLGLQRSTGSSDQVVHSYVSHGVLPPVPLAFSLVAFVFDDLVALIMSLLMDSGVIGKKVRKTVGL